MRYGNKFAISGQVDFFLQNVKHQNGACMKSVDFQFFGDMAEDQI
jgi:hypothetical protein